MNHIIELLKYSLTNDIGFQKNILNVGDYVSDDIVSITNSVNHIFLYCDDVDVRCNFRRTLKQSRNVSFFINTEFNTGAVSDISVLLFDNFSYKKYMGFLNDAWKKIPTIVIPFLKITEDDISFLETILPSYQFTYFYCLTEKGRYFDCSLKKDGMAPGDSGILLLSQVPVDAKSGYSYFQIDQFGPELNRMEELQKQLEEKEFFINYLNAETIRIQRFPYLLAGPLIALKRITVKALKIFLPTKLVYKFIKAIREGGMKTATYRIKSYLRLQKLNEETDYSVLFANKNEYVDFDSEYQENIDFSDKTPDVKVLAYYLPQYHTFKENDEWWGKGFTEWSNTSVAKPRFNGHYQPRIPHRDIGYYDLSDIRVLEKQAKLAKQHGIYGFCFYYYWFSGKRLMEKPVDMLLEHPEIDLPFCLCWANENWTRAWDGQNQSVLIAQNYSDDDDRQFMIDMKKYINDKRYIRINGKPLVVVYNPGEIPDCHNSFSKWRETAREIGLGEILIWTCQTANNTAQKLKIEDCIDAEVEFPPHNTWLNDFAIKDVNLRGKSAFLFNYQKLVEGLIYNYKTGKDKLVGDKPIHHACMMAWDNAARRKDKWFTYHNFSLKSLYDWVSLICEQARRDFDKEERFVFINAWNEWAEGTYLEPDQKYGYANINTVSKALTGEPLTDDLEIIGSNASSETNDHFCKKIAVQIHMFYTETLDETIENINKIPFDFDCFVSTDTTEKADFIRESLSNKCKCRNAIVEIFDNRGRDVAPFILQMSKRIDQYDYICHIHSKRTVTGDHGSDWRRYIFKHLFGNEQYLRNIFSLFESDEKLGLLFPETFPPLEFQAEWGGNLNGCKSLLKSLNIFADLPQHPVFPVGNMFWAKTEAIRALFKLGLETEDFPEEQKQVNGTIAHYIERCWVYIAQEYGFKYRKIFNNCSVETALSDKKRIAFYAHYNKENILSESDYRSLTEYSKIFDEIVFVSNSDLNENDRAKIRKITGNILFRENTGLDFGAWKYGLEQFGYSKLNAYDQVTLLNNSTFCPLYDMHSVFSEMEAKGLDFWGLTLFPAINDGSYIGKNSIPEHLQSYFVVFEKTVIESGEIKAFFDRLIIADSFIEAVANGEVKLTEYLRDKGFRYAPYITESYYICSYLNTFSLPYDKPSTLVLLGCPLVKKKAFDHMLPSEKRKLDYIVRKLGKQL